MRAESGEYNLTNGDGEFPVAAHWYHYDGMRPLRHAGGARLGARPAPFRHQLARRVVLTSFALFRDSTSVVCGEGR